MRDPFQWSISLGRWGIPTVRLHGFFLIFAAATYFLTWQDSSGATGNMTQSVTAAIAVLLFSVLAHEWGHWLVAHRYGIAPRTLVIGPLGGATKWPYPAGGSRGTAPSMLAGPVMNLLICLVCLVTVHATWPEISWAELLHPLEPVWGGGSGYSLQQALLLTIWINWLLFLLNLLPAFPFDGGRILRALLSDLRPGWAHNRVVETVFWIAVGLSTILTASALILFKQETDTIFPTSYALLLLAVVLFLGARQEADEAAIRRGRHRLGDEQGREPVGDVVTDRQWRPNTRDMLARGSITPIEECPDWERHTWNAPPASEESREDETGENQGTEEPNEEPRAAETEAEEERQLDVILSRLHAGGLECLTREDRELLARMSARYRSRLK